MTAPSTQALRFRLLSKRVEFETERFLLDLNQPYTDPATSKAFRAFTPAQLADR